MENGKTLSSRMKYYYSNKEQQLALNRKYYQTSERYRQHVKDGAKKYLYRRRQIIKFLKVLPFCDPELKMI